MICGKVKISVIVGGFICFLLQEVRSLPIAEADIGPAVYHAAIIGNYAGQLSGGVALSKLKFDAVPLINSEDKNIENEDNDSEQHDFSEGAAKDSPSLYESVGEMGDHLNEKDFPPDYEAMDENKAKEYAEEEAQGAASEHYEDLEQYTYDLQKPEENNKIETDFENFIRKPVPGIDHGKGVYSYSTTYEFPKH